jgi:hypothetical protein
MKSIPTTRKEVNESRLFLQVELHEASPRLGKVLGAEQDEGEEGGTRGGADNASTTPRPPSPPGGDRKMPGGSKRTASHSELTNSVLPPSDPRPVASFAARPHGGSTVVYLLLCAFLAMHRLRLRRLLR